MDTTAELKALPVPPQALLAGLVAIPVYVLPVGIWGLKALYPRMLRNVASGAITLGMLSLVGLGLRGLSKALSRKGSSGLENFRPLMPDDVAASAASAH